MNGRVVAIMLLTSAVDASPHRNAGTYTLTRGARASVVTQHNDVVPECKPDEPMPTDLIIKYSGPESPVVVVNGEEWENAGLTTGGRGARVRHANKPNPPTGTHVAVFFRRSGTKAMAVMHVRRSDQGKPPWTCATAFKFSGTYRP